MYALCGFDAFPGLESGAACMSTFTKTPTPFSYNPPMPFEMPSFFFFEGTPFFYNVPMPIWIALFFFFEGNLNCLLGCKCCSHRPRNWDLEGRTLIHHDGASTRRAGRHRHGHTTVRLMRMPRVLLEHRVRPNCVSFQFSRVNSNPKMVEVIPKLSCSP